jgi:gas vesicle protein
MGTRASPTAQALEASGKRFEKVEAWVKDKETGRDEVETDADRNDKAEDARLLSDPLKATQASVDQLRDEKNKTLREDLKSVQEQLRDALSLLLAQQQLSNAAAHEAGAFPSAAPIAYWAERHEASARPLESALSTQLRRRMR